MNFRSQFFCIKQLFWSSLLQPPSFFLWFEALWCSNAFCPSPMPRTTQSLFTHTKDFFFFLNNQIKRKKWCIKCKLCIILVFQKRVYNIIYPRFSKIKYYLPMRKDSRRRFANMTWSVGLATPPDSETLVLIWIVLNRTEPNNTSIVAATVFVTSGPRPCFSRSSNFTTTLLTGVPNPSVKIRAASTATIVNRSWNISMNIIFVTRRGSLTWIKYKFAWVCYKQWWKRTCCWV